MDYVRVAALSEIEAGQCKVFGVGTRQIALYNISGEIYATDNACAHHGGPLGEGILEGFIVTCPWHGWSYDVRTGASTSIPNASVKTFPVKVDGPDILVGL